MVCTELHLTSTTFFTMSRYGPPSGLSSIVYIGLIPFEWDEDNLRALVCGMGNVTDVRLGFDHVGKNKGYAFVEFETPQQAQQAMALISQVKITHPGSRMTKKLRVELSKEGFRTGNNEFKSVIPPNFSRLPPGVQLPPEVMAKFPNAALQVPQDQFQRSTFSPLLQQYPQQNAKPPVLPQHPGSAGNTPRAPQAGLPVPNGADSGLPERFLRASQTFPTAETLPFEKSDKINETLGIIPPAQLVEVIANLKQLLASGNAARAAEVFQISPQLATCATQALLLMGFIDEDVIQEAMKAESRPQAPGFQAQPQYPAQAQPSFQNQFPGPGQYQNNQFQGQAPQAQFGNSGQGFSRQDGSKWPHLPLSTQMKLGAMPPDQAELVAQVLSLTNDQISALPPDRQNMVAGIRQQYL